MNTEFFTALELLEKEKGIPADYMIEKIEAALVSAYKKEFGNNTNVRVLIDPAKKDVRVYQCKDVVEVVENPETQISLEDAKAVAKKYKIGMVMETEVKTKNFRRLSAAAAKSVIIQGIREGERRVMQEAYENKHEEIITATVSKVDRETGNVILETDSGRAVLRLSEQIPGEDFYVGDKIKVFVMEVNKEAKGPIVTLSRVHPGLVRRMFELEVPEITDGIVMVKGVSREAGSRTKISVFSRDADVDPVGACIGTHGSRIASIVDELRGEKVDIIEYSEVPEEYIAAALAPAEVLGVTLTAERACRVRVAPDQLSLAIGKEGQNARLAARLTGYKIDIKAD
ncbi:MAG: transcription termination/antitermination protein NusA [Clostridia bacterium]|nr:transcription termination/antitermination protein NusA [Clostridia bacterium]MBR2926665.1 transcription termination/antitermination protein NusA [Clostridia bacterium]